MQKHLIIPTKENPHTTKGKAYKKDPRGKGQDGSEKKNMWIGNLVDRMMKPVGKILKHHWICMKDMELFLVLVLQICCKFEIYQN